MRTSSAFGWEELRPCAALAPERWLSAAARQLEVARATVARRVAALESACGVTLVDPRSGRPRRTAAGARRAGSAGRIEVEALAAALAAARAARSLRDLADVEISVSAPPAIARRIVAPRRPALARTHPRRGLRLAAAAGLGVAVLPDLLAEAEGLATVDIFKGRAEEAAAFVRDVRLVTHEDLRDSPDTRAEATLLARCFAQAPDRPSREASLVSG